MQRHPAVFVLTIMAAVIVVNFAVDVLYASFPGSTAAAALKQSVTGA